MKSRDSDICVICGKNAKEGRDHIPPRAIFPKPWPNDFITVPACKVCNNNQSGFDEKFKVSIGLIAGHGKTGEELFKDQTIKTLNHNRSLSRNITESSRMIDITSKAGIFLCKAPATKLDSKSYDTVINRIIRGLHFYHSGYILGDHASIKINWYYQLSEEIYNMTKSWGTGIVGKAWSSGTVIPKLEKVEQKNPVDRK